MAERGVSLIADALRWLGFEVIHILGPGATAVHPYTPAARIVRGRLSQSAAGAAQQALFRM
jgi:hypothetical protein